MTKGDERYDGKREKRRKNAARGYAARLHAFLRRIYAVPDALPFQVDPPRSGNHGPCAARVVLFPAGMIRQGERKVVPLFLKQVLTEKMRKSAKFQTYYEACLNKK